MYLFPELYTEKEMALAQCRISYTNHPLDHPWVVHRGQSQL